MKQIVEPVDQTNTSLSPTHVLDFFIVPTGNSNTRREPNTILEHLHGGRFSIKCITLSSRSINTMSSENFIKNMCIELQGSIRRPELSGRELLNINPKNRFVKVSAIIVFIERTEPLVPFSTIIRYPSRNIRIYTGFIVLKMVMINQTNQKNSV